MPSATPYSLHWSPAGKFHHVGFVVAAIQECAPSFAEALEADWDGHIIDDPNQSVRVSFLCSRSAGDPLFELVEPAGENTPVLAFLKKGGGFHHVCFEVEDLEAALTRVRSLGALITRQPMPAAAFGGRRIAWVYTRQKMLIEYLERTKHAE